MCGHGADDVGIVLVAGTPAYPAHPSVLAVLAGAMLRAMKALRLPAP